MKKPANSTFNTTSAAYYIQLAEKYGTPSLILDAARLAEQFQQLQLALPTVTLHYAIKSLPDASVIQILNTLNAHFEIASQGEIKLLRKSWISPQRVIHTHPIKTDIEIRRALRYGCTTFVVDNLEEIKKFIPYRHRVGLLLRLSFPNPNTKINLSKKFGCEAHEALSLIKAAKALQIHIKGLCFHVGSQTTDPIKYCHAIETCHTLITQANALGHLLTVLDIGGGFPVPLPREYCTIMDFCAPIRKALQQLPSHVQVIAEPGRFLAAPSMISICQVVGKARRKGKFWYYLDDGVYGSFSGQIYDHANYAITALKISDKQYPSVLAGPTCDSIDIISNKIILPELDLGDYLIGHNMGAYTFATASNFNSLKKPHIVVINTEKVMESLSATIVSAVA